VKLLILNVTLFLAPLSLAWAQDHMMVQAEKNFLGDIDEKSLKELQASDSLSAVKEKSVKEITIQRGDTLKFANRDIVLHNIYADFFDLKGQHLGETNPVKFEKNGDFEVKCRIHPKMMLHVHVVEKKAP
jgi:plastocyanin